MPRGVSRYDEARLQGQLWTPAQEAGLLFGWYDFSNLSTLTVDGSGNVSQVRDFSGKGNHANQIAVAANPPFVPAGSVAGIVSSSVNTDGARALLMATTLAYNNSVGLSVAAVTGTSGGTETIIADTAGSGFGGPEYRWSGGALQCVRRSQALIVASSNSITGSGLHVAGFANSSATSQVWLDGVSTSVASDASFSTPPLGVLFNAGGTTSISSGSSSEALNGRAGEVIVMTTVLPTYIRNCIDGYLAWKWGLVSQMPASHPFKNRPPLIGD